MAQLREGLGGEKMIANYGYKDGSGEFFISIDTAKCAQCEAKPCIEACPEKVLEIFTDDYDDEVIGVKEEHRKKIKYSCGSCKLVTEKRNLSCQKSCSLAAITHSW